LIYLGPDDPDIFSYEVVETHTTDGSKIPLPGIVTGKHIELKIGNQNESLEVAFNCVYLIVYSQIGFPSEDQTVLKPTLI
jgi:hypothetical protein